MWFLFFYVYEWCACMYIYEPFMLSDALELQMALSAMWVLGIQSQSSRRAASASQPLSHSSNLITCSFIM